MMMTPVDDSETQRTLQVVQQFHDAFNQHDVPALMAMMTEDCVFENTYPAPDGTRLVGQDSIRDVWTRLFYDAPQAHFAVEELFASGLRAVLRWHYTWDPGEAGHVRGVDIYRIRDGKVAEKLSYVKG